MRQTRQCQNKIFWYPKTSNKSDSLLIIGGNFQGSVEEFNTATLKG